MKLRFLKLLSTLSLFPLSAFGADLYVSTAGNDSNSGAVNAPLRTIQRASDLAVPGTTVYVAPGTYQETLRTIRSGTASARIRFVSQTKWAAKLVPENGAYTMWDVDGGYIEIDGFQVTSPGNTTVRVGISLTGGNSTVKNSWIHHLAENSGCNNMGGAGLHSDQSKGISFNNYNFLNNVVHHVGGGCHWIQGIYHQSTGNIKNNLIYAASQGIDAGHDAHDLNIANNTIFGNSGYGIYFGGCKEAYTGACPTSGVRIYSNIIYDNYGGIQGPILSEDVDNEIKNNIVYGNTVQYDLASPSKNSRSGEINADPQFVSYNRSGTGNYHLKSTSPAIDRAIASTAPALDLDGVARQGAGPDIGAFEYFVNTPPPTPTPTPTPPPVEAPAANIAFSSSAVAFPEQLVGTASATVLVEMKNSGNAVLDLSKTWSISGDFAFGNIGTCEASLAPGASCSVSLKFAPTVSGVRTGVFTLLANTKAGTHSLALSGTGVSPAKPVLSVSANSMSFGSVRVGSRSSTQLVVLKNTGNAALRFQNGFLVQGDFALGGIGTCKTSYNYAPGTSCTVSIVFKPKQKGARAGTLTIQSNASSTPTIVRLTGYGM